MTGPNLFPEGWDNERVQRLIEYYESLTEQEATAEDEAVLQEPSQTVMEVPNELVPAVRALIAEHGR